MASDSDTKAGLPQGHPGSPARDPPAPGHPTDCAVSSPSAITATPAAAVVLDKLACLDVARKAERDRRREESRAAADPRESVARFLKRFAARQRNVEEAVQRMLLRQDQPQLHQQPKGGQEQQLQAAADIGDSELADLDTDEPTPLSVSAATPEQVQASLELISAEVLSMEQYAATASYYLPPYDQKQCAAAVAALRAAVEGARASLAPRRRFAFGSTKVSKVRGEEISAAAASTSKLAQEATAATAATAAAQTAAAGAPGASGGTGAAAAAGGSSSVSVSVAAGRSGTSSEEAAAAPGMAAEEAPGTAAGTHGPASTTPAADAAGRDDAPAVLTVSEQDRALVASGRGLMGLTDATVVLRTDEVSEGGAGGDFVLLGLTRCRVVLLGRLRALRAAGLRSCNVVVGPVTGACFVDDVRGSSLSLATYQVRVHRTHRTELFLRVRSNPIIEHSTAVRVAPWDAAVAPEPRLQQLLQAHKLGEETGCWKQVDDFGWIKSVQSPNWSIMPLDEQPKTPMAVPEGVWEPAAAAVACPGNGTAPGRLATAPARAGDGDVDEI